MSACGNDHSPWLPAAPGDPPGGRPPCVNSCHVQHSRLHKTFASRATQPRRAGVLVAPTRNVWQLGRLSTRARISWRRLPTAMPHLQLLQQAPLAWRGREGGRRGAVGGRVGSPTLAPAARILHRQPKVSRPLGGPQCCQKPQPAPAWPHLHPERQTQRGRGWDHLGANPGACRPAIKQHRSSRVQDQGCRGATGSSQPSLPPNTPPSPWVEPWAEPWLP